MSAFGTDRPTKLENVGCERKADIKNLRIIEFLELYSYCHEGWRDVNYWLRAGSETIGLYEWGLEEKERMDQSKVEGSSKS